MKKLSLMIILLGLVLVVITGCSSDTTSTPVATNGEEAAPQPDLLIAEGRLQPVNSLDQVFSGPGRVAEVLVKEGDSVERGQVLVRLEKPAETQAVLARAQQEALLAQQALDSLQASAEVNLAQQRLAVIAAQEQRNEAQEQYDTEATDAHQAQLDLSEALLQQAEDVLAKVEDGGGIDQSQLAAAEARLASADAASASAQAALDGLEIKASMDGTVVDVAVQVGQLVTAGQPAMLLADFSTWVIKTDNLTEADIVGVKVGQKVNLTFDALPARTFSGEVKAINTRFEEKRGDITYTATIQLVQTDPQLRWGMTAAVAFVP